MEWKVLDDQGFMRRKYSNDTMRKLHKYVDKFKMKKITEGYNETLDRINILISKRRLRRLEEILVDRIDIKDMK